MKKEHPHAQVLRWIADGETVQISYVGACENSWVDLEISESPWACKCLLEGLSEFKFRLKPKTIKIGDAEIEAPIFEGVGYFVTDTGETMSYFPGSMSEAYVKKQREGRVFATKNAAYAAHEAITALLTQGAKDE